MFWDLDWIEKRSQLTPNKIAVVDGFINKCWSYKELNQRAHSLACFLAENGVKKGDRVAILCLNDICYLDFLFACTKIGAIFVPLNWRLSPLELVMILEDCRPVLIGYHSSFESLLPEGINTLKLNSNKFELIIKSSKKYSNDSPVNEQDPLTIIYTGGTTGKPKGVVLTHANIVWNAINTIVSWNLTFHDKTLTYLPMFHTGGLNALTLPILMIGGTVLIANEFDAEKAVQLIETEKCTIMLMVPTMYHLISQSNNFKTATFEHVKTFLSGGAPCPLPIYEAFAKKGISFKEGYGLTEAGPNNFYIDPLDAKRKNGSIGKPMIFNAVKIAKEDGMEAKPGEVGELLLKGMHVFHHYWNNVEATNETIKNGWLYTGDLAKKDEDGFFYIVGRKKEMIITGGENVYPLEVEQCIQNHPAVSEVAVIGLSDPKWGEMVTAFVSFFPNNKISENDLKNYCYSKLGKFKVPKRIIILSEIPKTDVGKINKKFLQTHYQTIIS